MDSKKEAVPALLNMLLLNYDNYLDIDDNKKISPLTKQRAREAVQSEVFKGIVSDDMKSTAVELIFL